jgi:hypothetical protein
VPALVGDGDDPTGLRLAPGVTFLQIDDEGHLERVAFGRKHHEVREHATGVTAVL